MIKLLLTITLFFVSIYSNCQSKVFFDDFVDNRNNWDIGEESSEISSIQNGKYKIKIVDQDGWHWFGNKFQFTEYSKYKLEALISQTQKPSDYSIIGLIFNAKDDIKSHFVFLLDTEVGSFELVKVKENKPVILQEWTKTPAVKLKNKIEIEKDGDNYSFFINGVYVTSKKIVENFGNTFGFYTGPLTECEIDYVKIQGGNFVPNNVSKKFSDDVQFLSEKGWTTILIKNQLFSASFIDDFKSKESSENWELFNETETSASSSIENERLEMRFNSKGRIRVPITESPMDLSKNNFDIISIFDKSSNSIYQGVIFGYKDSRNYSSITFSSSLKMMVYEKTEVGILTGDDQKDGIYAIENYDNELRLKKEDGVISIYFNGVKSYEINEANQPGNGVGVIAGGDETMNKAYVKYFSANIILPDEATFGINKKVNIVKVKKTNGVFSVPVELNGVLKIDFIFDSGASDVSISPDVALTLLRTGTIKKEDWLEGAYYKFADGSTAKSKRFKLNSLKVGNKIIKNVTCSISNSIDAPMLLGQSVLSKFGKYTFDNVNQRLILD